jgi:Ca2+:H+ antiporter
VPARKVKNKIHWLFAVLPATVLAKFFFPEHDILVFLLSAASLIPLANLLSMATEQLARHTGHTLGALLSVTFGNAGELLVGFFALRAGLVQLVKASLSGSILANLLLFLGVSMIAGGIKHKTLKFNSLAARTRATMLVLAAISLIFPAVYHYVGGRLPGAREADLSLEFAVILLITYGLGLVFTLHTHREFVSTTQREEEERSSIWSVRRAAVVLGICSALIGWMSEILADSVEPAAKVLGLTELFIGTIVVAVAGNAAESVAAIRAAKQNRMDLSVGISLGSSIQIALFVAPALVIVSHFVGPAAMDLVFTPVEIVALVVAIAISGQIAADGESNWLEGVQLIAVYLMLAVMFFLLP